ncbi:MGMT family protein [Streptomyces hoynatensis]
MPDEPERTGQAGHPLPELPDYADRVLTLTESIPPGCVLTYGDVARRIGEGGPRQVGRVMAVYGGAVPWWRVIRADGVLLPGHERQALEHYRAEGTPLREPGGADRAARPRVDLRRARWDGGWEATPPGEAEARDALDPALREAPGRAG